MRATAIAILAAILALADGCVTGQPKIIQPPKSLSAPAAGRVLTDKEKKELAKKKLLDEMKRLFAKYALLPPADADISACVQEIYSKHYSEKCRDNFTYYITPEEAKRDDEKLSGQFGGVGIEVKREKNKIIIIALIPGAPAARAGMEVQDVVLKVDGKELKDIKGVESFIRGKAGTKVVLAVFRQRTRQELIFTLTREIITFLTVKARKSSTAPGVGIVKIQYFDDNVPVKFAEAVVELAGKGAKSIVIDIRDNPGGSLGSVVALLRLFAQSGDRILTVRYRHSEEAITFFRMPVLAARSFGKAFIVFLKGPKTKLLKDIGIVVLINNKSASASEIFAGTMKDWGYPIVGEKSFGKGVGQEPSILADGSRLALTTFEFLVGNGRVAIRDKGVTPTIEIKMPEKKDGADKKDEKDDPQLMKAIEVLQSCGKQDPARTYECVRK